MKIGVDLHALQAPSCRGRGIGRYAGSLLGALVAESPGWNFVFYRREDLPLDEAPEFESDRIAWIETSPDSEDQPDGALQKVVNQNPHDLDWLLIPNPVVERAGYALPEPVPGGPRLAAVVHDLIPALFPHAYLAGKGLAQQYNRDLRTLSVYDLLVTNSEATRIDTIRHLGIAPRRTKNLSAAIDPSFFSPGETDEDRSILAGLGLLGPFFYYLGNVDWRKNTLGLLEIYAALPQSVREAHPLVLTFGKNDWFGRVLAEMVEKLDIQASVVTTGPIDDRTARALYRHCTLFLSPSLYEGFGLPILEAMSCGAAVVVADNSSQPEVVGPAGAVVSSMNPEAWAQTITSLVHDTPARSRMKAASLVQARRFSWRDSAHRLIQAIRDASPRRPLPRCPWMVLHASTSPEGYALDASRHVQALCETRGARVFLDPDEARHLPPIPARTPWYDLRLLDRMLDTIAEPEIVHVVDRVQALAGLVRALPSRPARLMIVGDAFQPDDTLRDALDLASSVECVSSVMEHQLREWARHQTFRRQPQIRTHPVPPGLRLVS